MKTTKEFVEHRFNSALQELRKKNIAPAISELDEYEKTLIYQYTINGYESLNEKLRDDKEDEYEYHLNNALDKLPNFQDVVYRGVYLSPRHVSKYQNAEKSDLPVTEKAFTSTTTSINVANLYGNTIFSILSQTGKKIEALSYYGINSPQNEKEVLFKSNTKFRVLEVEEVGDKFKITLEEIVS